jgi:hypothetical protein
MLIDDQTPHFSGGTRNARSGVEGDACLAKNVDCGRSLPFII